MKIMKKIVIIGAGVAGINCATKLIDLGYDGSLITILDKGNNPFTRKPEEVMTGMLGAGGWSDGKLTYHTAIGGQLAKYCGDEKAMELMQQVVDNFRYFHPKQEDIMLSNPDAEPDFIKPYFGLRLFPVWHIGTDFLQIIAQNWYNYLLENKVNFLWQADVIDTRFEFNTIDYYQTNIITSHGKPGSIQGQIEYDTLVFAAGKSGIDFSQGLINKYKLKTEAKSVQLGVRFEAPQKYFQKLIDISYDFKLYQKKDNVSIRSFCTNNNAAYVAVEETYGDISYNGHAKKDPKYENQMTNFGILMEIKGIDNPFEWSRDVIQKCQSKSWLSKLSGIYNKVGLYYSPNGTREPSKTSEGNQIEYNNAYEDNLSAFKESFGQYADHILSFIDDMNKVFEFGDDWGMYIPEIKYVSPEPVVNHKNLALVEYPNVHFVGDTLSARGITVAGSQGIYVAESLLPI